MTDTVEAPALPEVHPEHRMLIDGELVESSTGATFTNLNPATEQPLGISASRSTPRPPT